MRHWFAKTLSGLDVPQLNFAIPAASEEPGAVDAEGDGFDRTCLRQGGLDFVAVPQIPQLYRPLFGGGEESPSFFDRARIQCVLAQFHIRPQRPAGLRTENLKSTRLPRFVRYRDPPGPVRVKCR